MRRSTTTMLAAAALALGVASVHAEGVRFSTDTCTHDYGTPYDVDVTSTGLAFHRDDGTPKAIFLHDGTLRVDGKPVVVSAADADALRRYEEGVRKLMPEVAGVAREAVEIGFSAMTTVTLSFADGDQRADLLAKLKRKQADALRDIDQGVGAGHWSSDHMTETVAGSVGDSVGELVGSVTSSAVSAALSGDQSKVAALQARAESLDKSLNSEMDKRSRSLDKRSAQICPQLNELASLQLGWHVRQPDGAPLQLMTIEPKDHDGDAKQAAEHGKKVVSF